MLNHTRLRFADASDGAVQLLALDQDAFSDWLKTQPKSVQTWVKAQGFKAASGSVCIVPGEGGSIAMALAGLGDATSRARGRFAMAAVAEKLPAGTYQIASGHPADEMEEHALGWLLSQYAFETYRAQPPHAARLVCPDALDRERIEAIAAGEALTRDLINTPTADMGPDNLEAAARALAESHGAKIDVVVGEALLDQNFPMIHAVGRASATEPRLIDMTWGNAGPTLVLVGKGVCFDTGGLNIKPGASMGLMKKDMGGSATVLGLAHMIMALGLPLKLRVLIPAVENSIDGSAFRPQDILTSRKGLTVEVNNTDAEGRLVLADALALADETPPDLMICMATLTGAARVAVGPDISPFFTDDVPFADALRDGARTARDPVWEMPFHAAYEPLIEPGIADLDNAPKGGFAGSITAALFLRRFVSNTARFAHFDIYGWQPAAAPGRPKGGVGMGARAILAALPKALNL
ncbi:leucyl aminopeptidase family protein [Litoreibacter janthinus]|uniref:Leucyl aminopeptidase n=1 Tax=Litoreibacter janthinus TaxID=670154 RepID=A0A1I6FY49_9RHOB|nr:leucyl aminopeptidase family protein [Litoreibacter janthinus]SFR34846.1 leucyl aminopeptidase [Litoreibacter janthinus]